MPTAIAKWDLVSGGAEVWQMPVSWRDPDQFTDRHRTMVGIVLVRARKVMRLNPLSSGVHMQRLRSSSRPVDEQLRSFKRALCQDGQNDVWIEL